MIQPSANGFPRATKRASRLWLAPTAAAALLCIAQGAWANNVWPTDYSLSYASYTSPTENSVKISYRLPDSGDACPGGAGTPTAIQAIRLNWCKGVDSTWDGQFWSPAPNVGNDTQPGCSQPMKYSDHMGSGIWANSDDTRQCFVEYTHTLEDALAPGKWVIQLNYLYTALSTFVAHHDGGNHYTQRVFELEAPAGGG